MDNSNLQEFSGVMDMVRANYDKPPLDAGIKLMWLQQLDQYSIEQVKQSAMKHLRTSQFSPKLADLITGLQGTKPKAREILAAARLKRTPFGVMAACHIGSWDLKMLDDYALETRAQEIVELHDGWAADYAAGTISDNHIEVMAKNGVMLNAPFRPDTAPPPIESSNRMIGVANNEFTRLENMSAEEKFSQSKIDRLTPRQIETNREKLLKMVGALGVINPKKLDDATCANCGNVQPEILKTCEQCGVKRDED